MVRREPQKLRLTQHQREESVLIIGSRDYLFILSHYHSSASFLVQTVILARLATVVSEVSRQRSGVSMTYRFSVFGHRLAM
jgi:hypothetical protein